jgi:hypothetical protein
MEREWKQDRLPQFCAVRLDRVRVVGGARWPTPLPANKDFTITDSFVRGQTSVRTYLRCRRMVHRKTGTKVYWQYWPQHRWLKPWRITFIANDSRGLWASDLEPVLLHCGSYTILLAELAFDFPIESGIGKDFVFQYGQFGKSQPRFDRGGRDDLRYGTRQSDKLVRSYLKPSVNSFRVEVEAHSRILRRSQLLYANDFPTLVPVLIPAHFRFVEIDWPALRRYLLTVFRSRALFVLERTKTEAYSLHGALECLRTHGVNNVHRFLEVRRETKLVKESAERWAAEFRREAR